MKAYLKWLIATVALTLILGVVLIGSTIQTYNSFVGLEKGVIAQYEQNQNNYDNMWKKFKESVQVSAIYAKDTEKIYKSAIEGRYGDKGSQAVFQFLKEQNPNIDASLYKRIQETVEAGRDSFEENQKLLIDKKRLYTTKLSLFPDSLVASVFNFPHIDLDKYGIVTSDRTEKAFDTKKDDEIKLDN